MSRRTPRARSQNYHWQTRQDLYAYFGTTHHLSAEAIDVEIARVRREFRPRQGAPIKPQELWEKVGRNLARRLRDATVLGGPDAAPSGESPTAARVPLPFPPRTAGETDSSIPDDAA